MVGQPTSMDTGKGKVGRKARREDEEGGRDREGDEEVQVQEGEVEEALVRECMDKDLDGLGRPLTVSGQSLCAICARWVEMRRGPTGMDAERAAPDTADY